MSYNEIIDLINDIFKGYRISSNITDRPDFISPSIKGYRQKSATVIYIDKLAKLYSYNDDNWYFHIPSFDIEIPILKEYEKDSLLDMFSLFIKVKEHKRNEIDIRTEVNNLKVKDKLVIRYRSRKFNNIITDENEDAHTV